MSLPTFDDNLNIIQQLDDEPNDVGGLTAAELKAKFDQGGKAIQTYLNEVLLPALEAAGVLDLLRTADSAVQYIRLNSDDVIEVSADGETWIATASSGHIILDQNGNQVPQRARMRFTNSEVTDNGTETVVHGIKGDKGDKGDQGDQGIQGIQGERGLTGPVIVPSIDANGVMSFTIQDTAITPGSVSVRGPQGPQGVQGAQGAQGERGPQGIQGVQGAQGIQGLQGETGPTGPAGPTGPQGATGPQGVKGDDGADGTSFVIQDIYPTLGALKAAYPTGNEYAYQVTAEDDEIFIWSELETDWVSLGKLQGPQGPQGPAGPAGPTGATGPTGPQGPQGIQGVQGPQGATGPEGPQGPAGVSGQDGKSAYQAAVEAGYSGTETAFNQALVELPSVETSLTGHIGDATKHITAAERAAWNAKQNALTFDNVPTSGSSNPVKSGGVHSALSGKQDALTFDNTPTENSANPVKSGGVFSALNTLGAQIADKASVEDIGNLWVWAKWQVRAATYDIVMAGSKNLWNSGSYGSSKNVTYEYSDSVNVLDDGTITFVSPKTVDVYKTGGTSGVGYSYLAGKFFRCSNSNITSGTTDNCFNDKTTVWYWPSDITADVTTSQYLICVTGIQKLVAISKESATKRELPTYVTSFDSAVYPENGQEGDYWYTRLGQIGQGMTKIETGSYVGTGTSGQGTLNKIELRFSPKVIFIANTSSSSGGAVSIPYGGAAALSVGTRLLYFSWAQNTVSWYSIDGAQYQLNNSGHTYTYVAIG